MSRIPLGGMPPTWKPEEGPKTIQGFYVGSKEVETKDTINGGTRMSMLYTLQQDNGSQISFWGNIVIDRNMKGRDGNPGAQKGDYLYITYLGKAKSKKGMTFNNFLVEREDDPDSLPAPTVAVDDEDEEEDEDLKVDDNASSEEGESAEKKDDIPF